MISAEQRLDELWARGCEFLGAPYAIMGGAMSWVSERHLVAAISNAGGFGVIACGAMTAELLQKEIAATRKLTNKPFGVNLITMHPQLDQLVKVCINNQVSHIVLAGGLPNSATLSDLKQACIKTLCFAPSLGVAKRLINLGAEALIIEGMEAGGHIGPVSTSVLTQEILPHIDMVPVFVAGGIGRGDAMVSFLERGASGCQLGTRFVCATESIAHPKFKQAFIRANARNAVPSLQLDARFPVIPVRAIQNDATQKFIEAQREIINKFEAGEISQKDAQLAIEHFWAGSLRRAVIDGDIETGSMMAGQSVGMVQKEQSSQEIVDELVSQAIAALEIKPDIANVA